MFPPQKKIVDVAEVDHYEKAAVKKCSAPTAYLISGIARIPVP
jgi:hypothetical protein